MTHVTASTSKETYRTVIKARGHEIIADEPLNEGGQDLGPKPGEFLASALASCTGITLRMYADRKNWDLQETMIDVTIENFPKENRSSWSMSIRLFGNLTQEQRERLLEIAGNCPVHKMLKNPIAIQTSLKD